MLAAWVRSRNRPGPGRSRQLTDFLSGIARVGPVRIAVLADIHGNLPALRAVLAEIDQDPVDAIVVAGDVVGGPLVRDTLELLAARREPTRWIRGNCEREAVAIYDGAPVSDDPPGRAAAWSAKALDGRWRDELAAWPISLGARQRVLLSRDTAPRR